MHHLNVQIHLCGSYLIDDLSEIQNIENVWNCLFWTTSFKIMLKVLARFNKCLIMC